jgi:hypothetical protein
MVTRKELAVEHMIASLIAARLGHEFSVYHRRHKGVVGWFVGHDLAFVRFETVVAMYLAVNRAFTGVAAAGVTAVNFLNTLRGE